MFDLKLIGSIMKKKWIILVVALVIVAIALGFYFNKNGKTGSTYMTETLKVGSLTNKVSSTGTLKAMRTVEVGTQVSGIIDQLYVDFNDNVRKGQLLAVLDTVLLKSALEDAQANHKKVTAQLEQSRADHARSLPLFEKGLISEAEYLPIKTSMKTNEASLQSAISGLQRAERNLKYAFIRSPIDGKVIQRNIEQGQTVAASLQAPTLFLIAEDMSKMEIHALVDESDIGLIKEGQDVTFTVQTYDNKTFTGKVRQIRLQPETVQNIVNYTVVIDAQNDEYLLLPGMTATVDFIIDQRENVLLVPNAAMRFQPPADIMQKAVEAERKRFAEMPDSVKARFGRGGGMPGGGAPGSGMGAGMGGGMGQGGTMGAAGFGGRRDFGSVWLLDEKGEPAMARFRSGVTDGKMTEVVRSRDLKEGSKVIIGTTSASATRSTQTNGQSGGRPPMRMF